MKEKIVEVTRETITVYTVEIKVQVPDGMSNETVVKVLENELNVQAEINDDLPWGKDLDLSHEITADGRVKLLNEEFHFGWYGDEYDE